MATTRVFELTLTVQCENEAAEDGLTSAVIAVARQLHGVGVLMSHRAMPKLTLKYHSSRTGKVVMRVTGEEETPPEVIGDQLEDLVSPSDAHSS